MFSDVHWTEEAEAHIARHGVTPDEVEELLTSRRVLQRRGRDKTLLIFGRTHSGRWLLSVVAESSAEEGSIYVVTAREMTDSERRSYKRRWR